jgi:hypothetical protein
MGSCTLRLSAYAVSLHERISVNASCVVDPRVSVDLQRRLWNGAVSKRVPLGTSGAESPIDVVLHQVRAAQVTTGHTRGG